MSSNRGGKLGIEQTDQAAAVMEQTGRQAVVMRLSRCEVIGTGRFRAVRGNWHVSSSPGIPLLFCIEKPDQ
ncbi:hypothetical protein ACG33_10900 [Steroidobacter denitrificans]|uniref:Uncharacterized protein n=1 Tax=Steroidobacter denitrificans TaxID=465721 RepID=A0A127FB09_STEDE|nr:hypothetical protein ACG33_10900 [Steroidobacter denitrificans]